MIAHVIFKYCILFQDEITAIPFFDISIPKEVAVNIFKHLNLKDLCHCAQVDILIESAHFSYVRYVCFAIYLTKYISTIDLANCL